MTLKELESKILALTAAEKAQVIQLLSQNLGNAGQGIEKTLNVCGGSACLINTRIPVWILVEARQLGITEAELLQDYPHISAADLVNAWAYAASFPDEIEAEIQENAAVMQEVL
jgi:uncharacterized protein (DUF433 family)